MPQSLDKIICHLIFSTKNHAGFISKEIENHLFSVLGKLVNENKSFSIKVGGHLDHVHIIFGLGRVQYVAKLVEKFKVGSSIWMKEQGVKNFSWQDGYSIFSVNPKALPVVLTYVENQRSHHEEMSFKDELRMFLNKYEIEFEEKYLWD